MAVAAVATGGGGEASLAGQLGLPGLPRLEGDLSWASGPHETCNYLLPGRLLAGSFPGALKEPEHTQKVRALLEAGVDTFVCLQDSKELLRFTPYLPTARAVAAELLGGGTVDDGTAAAPREIEFWQCEIPDGHITSSEALERCLATIVDKLVEGRQVYVHCWGGHGRTGSVLCALLVRVYGLSTDEAQEVFLGLHRQRRNPRGGRWPHSIHQHRQVQAFEGNDGPLPDDRLPALEDWALGR